MAKKPSLSDLIEKKSGDAAPTENNGGTVGAGAGKRPGVGPDGRKGVLVRIEVAGWRQLRDLAAELTEKTGEQVSMQSLLVDSINDLLKRNGRPPVA